MVCSSSFIFKDRPHALGIVCVERVCLCVAACSWFLQNVCIGFVLLSLNVCALFDCVQSLFCVFEVRGFDIQI